MKIKIISAPITRAQAVEIGKTFYPDIIKGVVDIEKEIIALGGEYHIDANMVLIEHGSQQKDVWGFNVYHEKNNKEWIEYTSLINIRPAAKNRTMTVEDKVIRDRMKKIIESLIQ